ncbi:MAG: BMP family ABC transporter substrate-binding protein [Microbacteriaceae bacterium]
MPVNKLLATVAIAAVVTLGLAACSAPATPTEDSTAQFKVGIISDASGFNDRGFNDLTLSGAQEAAAADSEILVEAREAKAETDFIPSLQYFAQQGFDLVIAVGFAQISAVSEVAPDYPETDFAVVDVSVEDPALAGMDNVSGIIFKEEEAAYLAGVLVGDLRSQGFEGFEGTTVSTVGGEKQPPVDRFIAGFGYGVTSTDPSAQFSNSYSQTFSDQTVCKQLASAQIAAGSDVIFAVAGNCGLGALDAAKEAGVWGIGVDSDQSFLGDFILTSVVKRADVAVANVIMLAKEGNFAGGSDASYGIENDGVGLGATAPGVPASALDAVAAAEAAVKAGTVTIPTTVK